MEPTNKTSGLWEDAVAECVPPAGVAPPDPPAAEETAEPGVPEALEARREALAPHYAAFLGWVRERRDGEDVPRSVEIGDFAVELGSWERAILREAMSSDGDEPTRAVGLLAEGVAVQVKSFELRHIFDHGPMPPPSELPDFLDGLITHLGVGLALQHELQRDVNRLVGSGRVTDAKNLSLFRTKIVKEVSVLKERIGPAEQEQAERRAGQWVTLRPDEPLPGRGALTEEEPTIPNWATYGGKQPSSGLPPGLSEDLTGPERTAPRNWLRPLLWVLAGLLVAYGAVILPHMRHQPGPPALTLQHFSHIESVRGIMARPPSLYVVLDATAWQAGSDEEQRWILEEIGRIAGAAGYAGVHARTSDGATVGQWMRKTGVLLIRNPAGST